MNGLLEAQATDAILNEEQLLADIVEAMLDAESQLSETASEQDWVRILISSCRRRRHASLAMVGASC